MWPQKAAKCTGVFTLRCTEALYSLQVRQSQGTSFSIGGVGMSSKKLKMSMMSARISGRAGAIENPQLPLIEVVTP